MATFLGLDLAVLFFTSALSSYIVRVGILLVILS